MRPARRYLSDTMRSEWRRCPRCKTNSMKPELIQTETNGNTKFWWVCENFDRCNFPLDMPHYVYHVSQSPQQKFQKTIPLPDIYSLPEQYRHLYPLTFADSRPQSRCSSVISHPANSRNETTDSSDSTLSEKSSGQNRLKADSANSGIVNNNTNTPSTSVQSSSEVADNIDEDIEAATTRSTTFRTIQRKRTHDPRKSWAALIEKVASDPIATESIVNMEESELFSRMKEFFDAHHFQRTPICYKRPGVTRMPFRVEEIENCLRAVTREDWKSARKRMPNLTSEEQMALKTSTAEELLKSVGIDLQEKKKQAVLEKVQNVMKGISVESVVKRRKLEEDRKLEKKQKEENLAISLHQSVSARILSKRLKRDEEERSLSSTPASFHEYASSGGSPAPIQQQQHIQHDPPVHFHLGNPDDEEPQWGFDFDTLYADIHEQNHGPLDPNDPIDALLIEEPNELEDHHLPLHSDDEGVNDDNNFTGFGDNDDADFGRGGGGDSNFDFVNDNFDF